MVQTHKITKRRLKKSCFLGDTVVAAAARAKQNDLWARDLRMEEEQKCICRRQKNLPIDLIVSYIQFLAVDMCAKLTFEKKRPIFFCVHGQLDTIYYSSVLSSMWCWVRRKCVNKAFGNRQKVTGLLLSTAGLYKIVVGRGGQPSSLGKIVCTWFAWAKAIWRLPKEKHYFMMSLSSSISRGERGVESKKAAKKNVICWKLSLALKPACC